VGVCRNMAQRIAVRIVTLAMDNALRAFMCSLVKETDFENRSETKHRPELL
jgi:hypothetical protein